MVHFITEDYVLIDYDEYNSLILNKRIQYKVNFKNKEKSKPNNLYKS